MEQHPLAIFLGPLTLDRVGPHYVANWYDPVYGDQSHPLDTQWNTWLEKHFSWGPLTGIGFVFVPPEILGDHPYWQARAHQLRKQFCECNEGSHSPTHSNN